MTILVIDDDRLIYETIEAVLVEDGYDCLTAKDTHEADLVLETVPVHGMTLEMNLPGCRPMEWMQQIAMLEPDLIRRTVVITVNSIDETARGRIREAGAGLLLKPFTVSELREVIRAHVGVPTGGIKPVIPPAGSFRPIPDDSE